MKLHPSQHLMPYISTAALSAAAGRAVHHCHNCFRGQDQVFDHGTKFCYFAGGPMNGQKQKAIFCQRQSDIQRVKTQMLKSEWD